MRTYLGIAGCLLVAQGVCAVLVTNQQPETYFTQRHLAFKNETARRLKVWITYHTRNAKGEAWVPADPAQRRQAKLFVLGPGETMVLKENGRAVPIDRVRFWAEEETGWMWRKYLDDDLWLVPPDETGQRRYQATEIETFVYRFESADAPARLRERMIQVYNDTAVNLSVDGFVWCEESDGNAAWRSAGPMMLEPGKSALLKDLDGWLMHGNRVKIWAGDEAGELYRWRDHVKDQFELVDDKGYTDLHVGRANVRFLPTGTPVNGKEQPDGPVFRLTPSQMKIPLVVGQTVKQARAVLEKIGVKAIIAGKESDDGPVVGQDPPADWRALTDRVQLLVDLITPDLTDLTFEQAQTAAAANGLRLKTENGTAGTVKSQRPPPGTKIEPGAEIVVAFQPLAESKVVVPNFAERTWDAAKALAEENGLTLKAEDGVTEGMIRVQDPPAGTLVPRGAAVTVVLAPVDPNQITVPDVIGMEAGQARDALKKEGFLVLLEGDEEKGIVARQEPLPQTKLARGSLVRLALKLPDQVIVPDVKGLEFLDARRALGEKELVIKVAGERAGPAQSQDPPAGAEVARGATVTVVFQVAPDALMAVPDVSGMLVRDAKEQLERLGLVIQPADADPASKIRSQSPDPGAKVARGSVVTIFVQPPPDNLIAVPNVLGLEFNDAQTELEAKGLTLKIANGMRTGQAKSQDPPGGTMAPIGSSVTVSFAQVEPARLATPNVVGMAYDMGQQKLSEAGLAMVVETASRSGPVLSQNPAAGIEVPRGSSVSVRFQEELPPPVQPPPVEPPPPVQNLALVPDVVGTGLAQAKAILLTAGFGVGIAGDPRFSVVQQQFPPGGTMAPVGTIVVLNFAGVDNLTRVPNVIGLPAFIARLRMERAGLTFIPIGDLRGIVRAQTPLPSMVIPLGAPVLVFFTDRGGPGRDRDVVIVPDLGGANQLEARRRLDRARLGMRVFGNPAQGPVIGQMPAPGAQVYVGTTVDVTFPKGLIAVPDVVGKSWMQAKARVSAAGLAFSPNPPNATSGTSSRQAPAPGTMVLPGAAVEVFFEQRAMLVPNLAGMTYNQAKNALTKIGLVIHPYGDFMQKDAKVVAQVPGAGTALKPGDAVDVTFPGATAKVPNVVGLNAAAAKKLITQAGFLISVTGDPTKGVALQQTPPAGEAIKLGSTVHVTFPTGMIHVPNVVGMSLESVQSALTKAGLKLKTHGSAKLGHAVAQNPAGNAEVAAGTVVEVAFPDALVTVPNIVGQAGVVAVKVIDGAKLKAQLHGANVGGKVFKQDPAAGREAPTGSTVHIYVPDAKQVAVPNVVGMSESLAANKLVAEKLKMRIAGEPKKGAVRTQSPPAGTLVNEGSEVVVSLFPDAVIVPNVIGLTGGKASALLQQASLVMKSVGDVNLGAALKQDPSAGAKLKPGSAVTVYFPESGGPRTVPNLVGLTAAEVRARLDALKLKLDIRGGPAGNSVNQNPPVGTSVNAGTTVVVTFAATGQVMVPNVVGMSYSQARATLEAKKLILKAPPSLPGATVLTQSPAAGTKVAPNTTVSVTFAPMVQVPNVVGLSQHDAVAKVQAAHLVAVTKGNPQAGNVQAQDPPGGTYVKPNTTVTLTFPSVTLTIVPNVVGMSWENARSTLAAKKLVISGAADSPVDIVQSQIPAAGTQVAEGSKVAVKVSAVLVQVPNVVGMAQSQALAVLSAAKLKGAIAGGDPKAGPVKSQDPSAGSKIREGGSVRLTFPTIQLVAVPNVVGLNYAAAKSTLESRGLKIATTSTGSNGTAIRQMPTAGTMVNAGSTVTATFLEAPPPSGATVPNVKGMTYMAAKKALESAGLHLSTSGNIQKGRVQAQNPAPGAHVPHGTTVHLVFTNPMASERPTPPGKLED